MKKYLMTLAVAICCATTMAQTNIIAIGKYVDRFPHLKFSSVPRMQVNGDPWKATRDRIVRKRRENQGNPLPPPPPRSL